MGKSSLSITVASALPCHRHRPPPLPPLGPHLFKLGQAGHPPPSPATSARSNIKPRSRQPHIQGPSLQRRLSGAFSTRNLEVLPSLVTPQSAHPVPGGDGASGGSPSPHECVLVSAPISRVPLPPFPPPHPPHLSIHGAAHLLQCLASSGPARPCLAHAAHIYTIRTPLVCLHVFLILIHLRSYYNPATPRAGGYLARVVAVFHYLITPFLILRLVTICLDSFCFFGSF